MSHLKSYKELIIWQKSVQLVKEVFILTGKFPKSEIYGITSQMKRSALSIPSNIAEGYGRGSRNEHNHFLSIAYASALELETQVIIAKELKLAENGMFILLEKLLDEVLRMLNVMTRNNKKLNARS